jgi:hypothetical protein
MAVFFFTFFYVWHAGQPLDSSFKLYTVRQGIIYYKSNTTIASGGNVAVYFDHFGSQQLIEMGTPIGIDAGPVKIVQIGGLQYSVLDNSQCIKSKRRNEFSVMNINFMRLDSNSIRKYGIRRGGTVLFLGWECNRYLVAKGDGTLNGEIIEWRGIPLSVKLRNNGILQETVAYKVDTGANVPANLFELPKNIQIIDATRVYNQ